MQVEQRITETLTELFKPSYLAVINESQNHQVPPNSETHFKVIVVSEQFVGQRLLARHRAINTALADELNSGVHALAMHTYTAQEWQQQGLAPDSPACAGHNKMTGK